MKDNKLEHDNTHQTDETKFFFEGWELNHPVVENNYMMHQEMVELLQTWVDNCQKPSLRIFELGCGDAHVVSNLSQNTGIATYCGIDLSAMAFVVCETKLKPKG